VITPDRKEWHPVDQVAPAPKSGGGDAGGSNVIVKPKWAS
jgi:hypothetical protein